MRRSGGPGRGPVTCPACGSAVSRSEAREYDKYGDRWDRDDKRFEYLCKPCHRSLCHHDRGGLEELLVGIGAGGIDREEFLGRFARAARERSGTAEDAP